MATPLTRRMHSQQSTAVPTSQTTTLPDAGSVEEFLVPTDKQGEATSHYQRAHPKMWCPTWGKREKNIVDLQEVDAHCVQL